MIKLIACNDNDYSRRDGEWSKVVKKYVQGGRGRHDREGRRRRLQCVVHKGPFRRKPLWLQSRLSDVAGGLLRPSLLVALSDVIAEGKYTENEGREGRVSFLPFPSIFHHSSSLPPSVRPSDLPCAPSGAQQPRRSRPCPYKLGRRLSLAIKSRHSLGHFDVKSLLQAVFSYNAICLGLTAAVCCVLA